MFLQVLYFSGKEIYEPDHQHQERRDSACRCKAVHCSGQHIPSSLPQWQKVAPSASQDHGIATVSYTRVPITRICRRRNVRRRFTTWEGIWHWWWARCGHTWHVSIISQSGKQNWSGVKETLTPSQFYLPLPCIFFSSGSLSQSEPENLTFNDGDLAPSNGLQIIPNTKQPVITPRYSYLF